MNRTMVRPSLPMKILCAASRSACCRGRTITDDTNISPIRQKPQVQNKQLRHHGERQVSICVRHARLTPRGRILLIKARVIVGGGSSDVRSGGGVGASSGAVKSAVPQGGEVGERQAMLPSWWEGGTGLYRLHRCFRANGIRAPSSHTVNNNIVQKPQRLTVGVGSNSERLRTRISRVPVEHPSH